MYFAQTGQRFYGANVTLHRIPTRSHQTIARTTNKELKGAEILLLLLWEIFSSELCQETVALSTIQASQALETGKTCSRLMQLIKRLRAAGL